MGVAETTPDLLAEPSQIPRPLKVVQPLQRAQKKKRLRFWPSRVAEPTPGLLAFFKCSR